MITLRPGRDGSHGRELGSPPASRREWGDDGVNGRDTGHGRCARADRRRRARRPVDGDVPRPARRRARSPSSASAAGRRCPAPPTSTCGRSSCSGWPASRSEVRAQSEREFLPEGAIVMMDSLAGRKLADIIPSLNEGVDDGQPVPAALRHPARARTDPRAPAAGRPAPPWSTGHEVVERRPGRRGRDGHRAGRRTAEQRRSLRGALPRRPPTAPTAPSVSCWASRSTGAACSRTASRSTSPPTCGRSWRASRSASIYVNNADLRRLLPARQELPTRASSSSTRWATRRRAAAPPTPPSDTSERRLIELVRDRGRASPTSPCASTARPLAVDRRRRPPLPDGAGSSSPAMPPTSCRRTAASAGTPASTTPTTWRGSWRWCCRGTPIRRCSTPTTPSADRSDGSPSSRRTPATSRAPHRTSASTTRRPLAPDLDIELGYLYHSGAVLDDDDDRPEGTTTPASTRARAGSRLPHVWLRRGGQTLSTLDVAGSGFSVFSGPEGATWAGAVRSVGEERTGVGLHHEVLDLPEARARGALRPLPVRGAARPAGWLRRVEGRDLPGRRRDSVARRARPRADRQRLSAHRPRLAGDVALGATPSG